jgi:hypothetical protein
LGRGSYRVGAWVVSRWGVGRIALGPMGVRAAARTGLHVGTRGSKARRDPPEARTRGECDAGTNSLLCWPEASVVATPMSRYAGMKYSSRRWDALTVRPASHCGAALEPSPCQPQAVAVPTGSRRCAGAFASSCGPHVVIAWARHRPGRSAKRGFQRPMAFLGRTRSPNRPCRWSPSRRRATSIAALRCDRGGRENPSSSGSNVCAARTRITGERPALRVSPRRGLSEVPPGCAGGRRRTRLAERIKQSETDERPTLTAEAQKLRTESPTLPKPWPLAKPARWPSA